MVFKSRPPVSRRTGETPFPSRAMERGAPAPRFRRNSTDCPIRKSYQNVLKPITDSCRVPPITPGYPFREAPS
ncbi:hypothetical protein TNCV_4179731 [Trichonephila clavipes]|nr:hypothetical protein TNCV_4179731 [Trichonephila clavipes]